jgi:transposase
LGRSRGGFGTKIHPLVDGNSTPLEVEVTAGQVHDSKRLEPILKKVHIKQKRGRPKSRPRRLAGDKGYSSESIRRFLKDRGIELIIPHKDNEGARHDPEVKFDKDTYKRRSIVEQSIDWLKACRRIGTRFREVGDQLLGHDEGRHDQACPQTVVFKQSLDPPRPPHGRASLLTSRLPDPP